MPVFEQGYRPYVGERTRGNPAWAIAWRNIRPQFRWWLWALLFLLLVRPYFVYGVTILVAALVDASGRPGFPVPTNMVAFETVGGSLASVITGKLQSNPLGLFWDVLYEATFASLCLPAFAAAGLLASDRRTGGLQIYFARPVSRRDYLLGKVAAATFFVAMATALPCLLLWLETVALGTASKFTWQTWIAPLSIVGSSAFYAFWAVALVLWLSSLMQRPVVVAIAAIAVQLILEALGAVLARAMQNGPGLGKGWHMIAPSHAIGTLTAPLCGLTLPQWANAPLALVVAVGAPAAMLLHVRARIRAVEVAT